MKYTQILHKIEKVFHGCNSKQSVMASKYCWRLVSLLDVPSESIQGYFKWNRDVELLEDHIVKLRREIL